VTATTNLKSGHASALVVVGGSAGAIGPLQELVSGLPAAFPAAVVIVQHSDPTRASLLAPILARRSHLPVQLVGEGETLLAGHVYVIPPDRHSSVTADGRIHLSDGTRIRHVRSSANPLFESAASVFGDRVIAVVLSGTGMDATDGVQAVKHRGGAVIVQSADSAAYFGMPGAAIATGAVDYVLPVEAIADELCRLLK
jgi:two-component system chemotaxis response regulator CheB